jgi:hypothetical protein
MRLHINQPWPHIKAAAAHVADWGYQTSTQARCKADDPVCRLKHVGIVSLSHAAAAWTCEGVSDERRLTYVAVNAVTHYAIDSVKMPKIVDQVLHILVALLSAWLLRRKDS